MQLYEKERLKHVAATGPYDATRTEAWRGGFQPAKDLPLTHSMTVTVTGPKGPVRNRVVYVEFAFDYQPPSESGLAVLPERRDADGTIWIKRHAYTDEKGVALFDGLPKVQCKITFGDSTITSYPDSAPAISLQSQPSDDDDE